MKPGSFLLNAVNPLIKQKKCFSLIEIELILNFKHHMHYCIIFKFSETISEAYRQILFLVYISKNILLQ